MFDLATETTLNSVVSSIDSTKTAADGFPSLVNQVDGLLSKNGLGTCPNKANILHVHGIRNDAQHDARYPNNDEVSDSQTYTKDFLGGVLKLVWDVDFDSLSVVDLIQHAKIRAYLKDAENALSVNNFKMTIEKAVTGLELALRNSGTILVGSNFNSFSRGIVVQRWGKQEEDKDMMATLERMRDTLRIVALGLSPLDYTKFREITGHTLYSQGNEEPIDFRGAKKSPEKHNAEFALANATDAILMIESRVGDIDKPFGRKFLS